MPIFLALHLVLLYILIRNVIDILVRDVCHERNYLLVVFASGTNPGKQKYQRHGAVTVLEPVETTAVSVMCRAVPAGKQNVSSLARAGFIYRQILSQRAVLLRKILGSVCLSMNPFPIVFKQDCLYLFSQIIFWEADNQYEE